MILVLFIFVISFYVCVYMYMITYLCTIHFNYLRFFFVYFFGVCIYMYICNFGMISKLLFCEFDQF